MHQLLMAFSTTLVIVEIWRCLVRYCAHSFTFTSKFLYRSHLLQKVGFSRVHLLIAKDIRAYSLAQCVDEVRMT